MQLIIVSHIKDVNQCWAWLVLRTDGHSLCW